jgi:hypothetical protein
MPSAAVSRTDRKAIQLTHPVRQCGRDLATFFSKFSTSPEALGAAPGAVCDDNATCGGGDTVVLRRAIAHDFAGY